MKLDAAVKALPPKSPYRAILKGLMDPDEETRQQAYDAASDQPDRSIRKAEAVALLRAAVGLDFPAPQFDWQAPRHELIFALVTSPHAALVPIARAAYPRLGSRDRCAVLALFGACATRAAAVAFMACVRDHDWPAVYPRVFTELRKLAPFGDVLFPELVLRAGSNLAGVTDGLVDGLVSGAIDAKRVKLEPLAPLIAKSLTAALKQARPHQRVRGTSWRFTEAYWTIRRDAGAWLDLAGYVRAKSLDKPLRAGLALPDPRLALFAATSILRRGGDVPQPVLETIAACHETRAMLHAKLAELGALGRFPDAWRTWDAFAMQHMVEWLLYPSELGHEPDQIEQMAVVSNKLDAMYVYRFRDGARKPWLAGVAGPFVRRGVPKPLYGPSTFSQFAKWSSASPEGHVAAVAKTLRDWARARE